MKLRISPIPESTKYAIPALDKAFDKQVDAIKPGAQVTYNINRAVPEGETTLERLQDVISHPTAYAGSTKPGRQPAISINNALRELLPMS